MSVYFNHKDQSLWNPSHQVGVLFHDAVISAARSFGLHPGLGPITSDEVEVDIEQFEALINKLSETYAQSTHEVLKLQLWPVIIPGVVLLDRAGRPLDDAGSAQALRQAALQLEPGMAC